MSASMSSYVLLDPLHSALHVAVHVLHGVAFQKSDDLLPTHQAGRSQAPSMMR